MKTETPVEPALETSVPEPKITRKHPLVIKFHAPEDSVRRNRFKIGKQEITIMHAYPTLANWHGGVVPDQVNPRSHDENCLGSSVAQDIADTLQEKPDYFMLANRGLTILAEDVQFDKTKEIVTLIIADPRTQGTADGGTSDSVIAAEQARVAGEDNIFANMKPQDIPEFLQKAQVHLEIIVGLKDKEAIESLVGGRNTSRQVRSWSLANFGGKFNFLKDILEDEKSPFKGRIGYEENADKPASILDVLSALTVFHPIYDTTEEDEFESKAPTAAYASKGKMDRLLGDESMLPGYMSLSSITADVLNLYEYLITHFEKAYAGKKGGKRLGRRAGVKSSAGGDPFELKFTGAKSNYLIPLGLIYPLLASFRALVGYGSRGKRVAKWKTNPFEFFDKHGSELVSYLMEQVAELGNNPNMAGKKRHVYTTLHDRVDSLYSKSVRKEEVDKEEGKVIVQDRSAKKGEEESAEPAKAESAVTEEKAAA